VAILLSGITLVHFYAALDERSVVRVETWQFESLKGSRGNMNSKGARRNMNARALQRVAALVWLAVLPWLSGAATPGFEAVSEGVAVLLPTAGHSVHGIVRFTPHPEGIAIQVHIEGLSQRTRHGFHIHEFGDCSAADASSAGPHYDPTNNAPGRHQHGMRPLGDLDDLRADPQGRVDVNFIARRLSIAGPINPILGRALVLHANFEDPNDPMSQSGDRIACGTIGVLSPQAPAVPELPKPAAGG
jgi:Cu-Zn family superoxide dismutase